MPTDPNSEPAPAASNDPASKWFGRALPAVVVAAAALRLAGLGSVHVEQYDEGVYASNLWFGEEKETRYPERHLYAPPLLPAIEEYTQLILGSESWSVMLAPVLLGIVSVWLIGRLVWAWSTPEAALAVMVFIAISPMHLLFSRAVMTDVPMTACLLGALWLGWVGVSRKRLGLSVAAGVVTGLCWSFKYSGWLPLAIVGSAILAQGLFHVKRFGHPGREALCWLAMTGAAVVVWSPAWLDLQAEERGGYAAVTANHARYFDGPTYWRDNLAQQIANVNWFESPVSGWITGGVAALLIASIWVSRGPAAGTDDGSSPSGSGAVRIWLSAIAAGLGATAVSGIVPLFPLLLGVAAFGFGCRVSEALFRSSRESFTPGRALATWMGAAWFVSMFLATPLYHPYPRLTLPWLLATWVGVGFAIEQVYLVLGAGAVSRETAPDGGTVGPPGSSRRHRVLGAVACLLGVFMLPWPGHAPWWRHTFLPSRIGLTEASQQLVEQAKSHAPGQRKVSHLIYVYAEPAVFYQLSRLAGEDVAVGPVSDLAFVNQPPGRVEVPVFFVSGPHAEREEAFQKAWNRVEDRFELVSEVTFAPSDLVLLDEYSPAALDEFEARPQETLRLYRLRPSSILMP